MILRVIPCSVPADKKDSWIKFVNDTLIPAAATRPGFQFMYVASCIEKGHECEVIHISAWDSYESAEAFEDTSLYPQVATKAQSFYTARYQEHGPAHAHYETIGQQVKK